MPSKAEELISTFRSDTFDDVEPYFWSEADILDYLDEAQKKFCRVGVPIVDSKSTVTQLDITTGEVELPYHESITRIRTARLGSTGMEMNIRTQDVYVGQYRKPNALASTGNIRDIFVDYDDDYIRLSRVPANDDTLLLHVERKPINTLSACTDYMEVKEDYHRAIIEWALYRAYSKQDAETFDMQKATAAKTNFYDEVAEAKRSYRKRHGRLGQVSYGGI